MSTRSTESALLYAFGVSRSSGFYEQMHRVLRDRLLDAAAGLICAEGWDAFTMTRAAARVGVSRQAAYKQFASKTALGEAVVIRETDRMLAAVAGQLRAHDDPVAAITAAAASVLHAASGNPLIKALLTDGRSGVPGLLPLVAQPEPVLTRAIAVVSAEAQARFGDLPMDSRTIGRVSEIIVRLTLSHLIQPTGPIDEALAQVRLITENALAPLPGGGESPLTPGQVPSPQLPHQPPRASTQRGRGGS